MTVFNRNKQAGSSGQGAGAGYVIGNSCRFDGTTSYLNKTFGGAGSTTKMTTSFWMKSCSNSRYQNILHGAAGNDYIRFGLDDTFNMIGDGGGESLITDAEYRDPAAWYHFVIATDTTQGTAADRWNVYVNGVLVTSYSTETYPGASDTFAEFLTATAHYLGRHNTAIRYFDGYLAEFIVIDGTQYAATDFGETDTNGNWVPIDPSGLTFGTNGFWLDFAIAPGTGNGAGEDVSGNANHWTEAGLAAADQTTDSPTDDADNDIGNYCTINPLDSYASATISDGNLSATTGAAWSQIRGSMGMTPGSGKWYWEVDCVTNTYIDLGIVNPERYADSTHITASNSSNAKTGAVTIIEGGNTISIDGAAPTAYLDGTMAGTETFNFAYDADTGTLWIGEEGVWVDGDGSDSSATVLAEIIAGTTSSSAVTALPGTWHPLATIHNAAVTFHFRPSTFETAAPTGYKALHTGNLPAPAITDPSSAFNVLEFSGTGAERDTVFGGNSKLSPDLTIFRDDLASGVWAFTDKVRGATEELDLASTSGGENTVVEGVKDFAPSSDELDGVTLGTDVDYNASGIDITMYGWKEGVTQGFDIVTYTGNASATQTVGHNLGVKPGYMILMRRDTGMQSTAWHTALTGDNYMVTMSTVGYGAETASSSNFAASHDLDNFVVDNTGNTENGTYVMYLWADVPGFQKHGSFTGNGSDDGPFIWTGFRPRCLHLRRFDGNRSPYIYNTDANPFNQDPGTTGSVWGATYVELALNIEIDILSNGFKLRESAADINGSGITKHMWSAWAEAPFGGDGVSQARAR